MVLDITKLKQPDKPSVTPESLTEQDVQFLAKLKAQGMDKETALEVLASVKSKAGAMETPAFLKRAGAAVAEAAPSDAGFRGELLSQTADISVPEEEPKKSLSLKFAEALPGESGIEKAAAEGSQAPTLSALTTQNPLAQMAVGAGKGLVETVVGGGEKIEEFLGIPPLSEQITDPAVKAEYDRLSQTFNESLEREGFSQKAGKTLFDLGAMFSAAGLARSAVTKGAQIFGAGKKLTGLAALAGESSAATGAFIGTTEQRMPTLTELAVGGAIDLATLGLFKPARAIVNKLQTGAVVPNNEIVDLATKYRIDLPASAINPDSPATQLIEATARRGFFGGKITDLVNMAKSQVDEAIQALPKELTSTLDAAAVGSKLDFGVKAKSAYSKMKGAFNELKTKLYDSIESRLEDVTLKVVPANTIDTLEAIVDRRQSSLVPTQGETMFTKLFSKLKGSGKSEDLIPKLTDLIPGFEAGTTLVETSIEQLKQTRSAIGRLLGSNDPIATGNKADLKALYGALSEDLDLAYSSISPDFAAEVMNANNVFKKGISDFNSALGKFLDNADPEDIYKKFIRPNNPTEIEMLKVLAGKEIIPQVQGVFMKDLVESSTKNGVFNAKKFISTLGKWDEETLRTFLNEEQIIKLAQVTDAADELEVLMSAIRKGEKPAVGSQTAPLQKISKFVGGGLVGAGAIVNLPATLAVLTAELLGDYGLSRLFGTQKGISILTTGVPDSKAVQALEALFGEASESVTQFGAREALIQGE